jgi:hypothetical protein
MAWAKDFMEYVDKWLSRDNNNCRSFTYGSAMYDWIKEGRFDLDDLWIRYDMEQDIESESWANSDWVQWLSDEAIVEILDISVLDDYWDKLSDECDEEDKQSIFDELDSYPSFETRDQYEEIVQKLVEDTDNSNLNWRTVAEEYEDNNYLHIDEEENVQED